MTNRSLYGNVDLDVYEDEETSSTWRTSGQKYLNRKNARIEYLKQKNFVVWDGEGGASNGSPQKYILFGSFNGTNHRYITGRNLTTRECLDLIIKVGKDNPDCWHVGFAFGYDVNMILRSLTVKQFRYLRHHRMMRVGSGFRIEHLPGKWFQVTKYERNHKTTVRIYDVWGFFQSSFITALRANLEGSNLDDKIRYVASGKERRQEFTYEQLDFIKEYWSREQELFHALILDLKAKCYGAGLYIGKWHGPGELAAYLFRTNGIRKCKAIFPNEIYRLARYAYCGGRFERFHIGRFKKVFGYDINSAYPYAISKLPNLANGTWRDAILGEDIAEFGIYRIEIHRTELQRPGPLFRRDARGNVTFPWELNGWYWSPEVKAMLKNYPELAECVKEGKVFEDDGTRPFTFVRKLFNQRKEWKASGVGAQMALKLALNSMYGKMAQRAGWERNRCAPTWHQLEWAGWVTSFTRAKLFDLMCQMSYNKLIAVETDGIYTTATPEELNIIGDKELGGWEVTEYEEVIYLQSGVYSARINGEWKLKYRGLDSDSITAEDIEKFAKLLVGIRWDCSYPVLKFYKPLGWRWEEIPLLCDWPKLQGKTTRFIGYENALFREIQNRDVFKNTHCLWETTSHDIDCAKGNKRKHMQNICWACDLGLTAYEMPHDTVIKNRTIQWPKRGEQREFPSRDIASYPHDIPWIDDGTEVPEWRRVEEEREGLIRAD